jgi:hypothetical protein
MNGYSLPAEVSSVKENSFFRRQQLFPALPKTAHHGRSHKKEENDISCFATCCFMLRNLLDIDWLRIHHNHFSKCAQSP